MTEQKNVREEKECWVRVFFETSAELVDTAAALLWAEGASGVELRDSDTFKDESRPLDPGRAVAIAFFGGESAEVIAKKIRTAAAGWGLGGDSVVDAEVFTDETWKERWKQFFKPLQVSKRITVGPPWDPPSEPEGGVRILIEPGLAFGTGTHATTQLCLGWIDELYEEGSPASILDVGCGSGILSIASAGLLGEAVGIKAIDVDPEALRVSRENLEFNGIAAGRVDVAGEVLADVEGSYGFVMANILSHILLFLGDDLVRCTAAGGRLLLSGIGQDDAERVIESFVGRGLNLEGRREQEGWVALMWKKPA